MVDDEVGVGPAVGGERGGECVDEAFFVAVGVGGSDGGAGEKLVGDWEEKGCGDYQVARSQPL